MIGPEEKAKIAQLIKLAEANPVNMPELMKAIMMPTGKHQHMQQMTAQTIDIPMAYEVTYSIEDGQPMGRCRHLSMAVTTEGRIPNPMALWMVAKEFGFWGELQDLDDLRQEELFRGPERKMVMAIHIVQRLTPEQRAPGEPPYVPPPAQQPTT